MDTISELAAAGFFFAAGLLAAVTAPDWIIGAAVGVCLLLVGTVLFQKGMKQLMQEMQTRRTEEREQTAKQLEKLQTALDELQASEKRVWKQYAMKLPTCTLPRKMLVRKHRKRQKISYGRWIIRKTTSAEILKNFAGSWITQKRISALS